MSQDDFPPFDPSSYRPKYYKPSTYKPTLPEEWDIMDILQHYEQCSYEVRTAIKYLIRAGFKPHQTETKDLTKAMEYIQRRLTFMKGKGQ